MAYGSTPDAFDEYLQMSEHTARDALFFFNMCIIELYMPKYLRKPTLEDVVKIQQKHNNVHGFPGMLGSIDCMHWEWKNCPVSWQGQYGRGDKKYPTIMLEAVASQDLWIWHAFRDGGAKTILMVCERSEQGGFRSEHGLQYHPKVSLLKSRPLRIYATNLTFSAVPLDTCLNWTRATPYAQTWPNHYHSFINEATIPNQAIIVTQPYSARSRYEISISYCVDHCSGVDVYTVLAAPAGAL
ncbi:probable serine/threonine-protein kinase PBL7 [Tanacetum coccineum]